MKITSALTNNGTVPIGNALALLGLIVSFPISIPFLIAIGNSSPGTDGKRQANMEEIPAKSFAEWEKLNGARYNLAQGSAK
jgi:hypothetical protein